MIDPARYRVSKHGLFDNDPVDSILEIQMTLLQVTDDREILLDDAQTRTRFEKFFTLQWQAVLVGLIALAILVPRGLSIGRSQTLRVDDGYHLARGIRFWHKAIPKDWLLNDPLLGSAITALPILHAKSLPGYTKVVETDVLWDLTQRSINRIAVFKSVLFVPAVVLIFFWVGTVYGSAAGWLIAGLILIEPTFAAHIPIPTIDVLGVEGILFGSFFTWRFLSGPTWLRALLAGFFIAVALLTKHTAIILPAVALAWALLWWFIWPLVIRSGFRDWIKSFGIGLGLSIVVALIGLFSMWGMTLFDISVPHLPPVWPTDAPQWATKLTQLKHPIPGGIYFTSLLGAVSHGITGHQSVLFGKIRDHGWWYYFPAIATMKVPFGIFVVMILAVGSLFVVRPRWEELSLLLPAAAWTTFIMWSKLNIGFRHFLPAYVFILMLGGRALLPRWHAWKVAVWCGATWAAVSVANWHPDYLSYVNRDIDQVWLKMSDSNLDWSQGNNEVGEWVKTHVAPTRPVDIVNFSGHPRPIWATPNITIGGPPPYIDLQHQPTTGLYIVSPAWVTGQYIPYPGNDLSALRRVKPIAIIGHSMLVYDLDLAGKGKPFHWFNMLPNMRVPEGP